MRDVFIHFWQSHVQTVQVIATIVIAIVVAWIAWQQLVISRRKLRLDLFDKRFNVYDAAVNLLATGTGQISDEAYIGFMRTLRQADFLFKKNVLVHLNRIRDLAKEHRKAGRFREHAIDQHNEVKSSEFSIQQVKIEKEMEEKLKSLTDLFRASMDFRRIK